MTLRAIVQSGALSLSVTAAACGRIGFGLPDKDQSSTDASHDDAPAIDGRMVDTGSDGSVDSAMEDGGMTDGARCTPSDLMVTTSSDELDGPSTLTEVTAAGGLADLSLREAILIANNCPGPNTIHFDPSVFSPSAPSTISLSTLGSLPSLSDASTTLESRGAIVIVDGGGAGRGIGAVLEIRGTDVRVAGLGVQGADQNGACVAVRDADNVVIEALKITCSSPGATGISLIDADSAQLRNNTVTADKDAIHAESSDAIFLSMNTLTDAKGHCVVFDRCIAPWASDNTLLRCGEGGQQLMSAISLWERNRIEDTVAGNGILISGGSGYLLDNAIRRGPHAGVWIGGARIQLIANSITANGEAGIAYQGMAPVEPPVITSFDGTVVKGTARVEDGSQVEIFLDPDDEGETFLESGQTSSGAFQIDVTLPASSTGKSLTATVTDSSARTSPFSAPWKL